MPPQQGSHSERDTWTFQGEQTEDWEWKQGVYQGGKEGVCAEQGTVGG